MVVEMVQNSTFENFIHIQHLFIHIQHFHLFSINICSKFNTYIYIQQFYLFTKLLSIQKLFIHSTTFYSFKNYCASLLRMEVTYFLQQINRGGSKEARAIDQWNFEKDTDRFWNEFSEESLRRSEHLRLCLITLRWCPIDCLQIFFTREKCKEVLYTIRKINGVINPPMGKVLLLFVVSLYFKVIFSCVSALKLDKERVMESLATISPAPSMD